MGQPKDINQPKTLAERQKVALETIDELKLHIPVLLDDVSQPCGDPAHGNRCCVKPNYERLYGAWPLRFYVYDADGTVLLKGMPSGEIYDLDDIENCLQHVMSILK